MQEPFKETDAYVRQRLRVAFSCRGKKHGGMRQGKLLTVKYGNSFFVKEMGLIAGPILMTRIYKPDYSVEDYLEFLNTHKKKRTIDDGRRRFYRYAYAK